MSKKSSIIVVFIVGALFTYCSNHNISNIPYNCQMKPDTVLKEKLIRAVQESDSIIVSINELSDFEWDTMLVITSYIPYDCLDLDVPIDLRELKQTNVRWNDGISVLAFINDHQLVSFFELSEIKLAYYDSIRYYSPKTALFKTSRILYHTRTKYTKDNEHLDSIGHLDISSEIHSYNLDPIIENGTYIQFDINKRNEFQLTKRN